MPPPQETVSCRPAAALLTMGLVAFAGCDKPDDTPKTPTIAASAVVAPPPPSPDLAPKVLKLAIDATSQTHIDMPAPSEHIKADTTAAKGELTIVTSDLTKTAGQVKVDLTTLTTHTFGDPKKDGAQTEHAHNWLEAGDLVKPEVKEANRWVIFTVKSVDGLGEKDLLAVTVTPGEAEDTRKLVGTAHGDFFLHGHQVPKEAEVEVVFHYPKGQAATAKPTKVELHTKTPLHVVLADHDVKPRDNLGKIAQASFKLLGTKVADTADVSFELTATPAN